MIANALKRSDGNINYPGLIAAWSAKGKTNDDADRAILKDLTGNGHDITLNGFAFSEMSGYGGYNYGKGKWELRTMNAYEVNFFNTTPINGNLTFNISGITDFYTKTGNYVQIRYHRKDGGVNKYIEIKEDGFYDIDHTTSITSVGISMRSAGTDTTDAPCNIVLEMIPNYPDALVFDGVDDYGINEDMPILTDYTVICKREILGNVAYSCAISKYKDTMNGAFNFDMPNYNNINSVFSYGYQNNIEFPKNKISWMTPLNYNQQIIKKGTNVDGSNLSIGVLRGNKYFLNFVFYSAYIFDRSLDEQEIKAFIRKYIDPEYLLPSEILTPDCYYDFSKGSNDDENIDTIKDLSGNGNDAVAHNFAWSGMSGYGGYGVYSISSWLTYAFNNYTKYGRHKIEITVNDYNFVISISEDKTKINDVFKLKFDRPNIVSQFVGCEITQINELEYSFKIVDLSINPILVLNKEALGQVITIEQIPEYPGALVFDGVDDYVSLDAFDSGFKTMFIECSYVSLNTILYDQRKVGTEQEDCINTSAYEAGFYGRNKYGKTYINGVYNKPDSTLIASKLSNKHILITSTFKGDYTSTPCIASSNVNKGMYCNMALYKFLGFKEALTEEQIQAVIKKYNLLDEVDEIEVS